jgi:N-acetylglutamate synthase-like GNAT family acetyltransferase
MPILSDLKIRRAKLPDRHTISLLTKKYSDTISRNPHEIAKIICNFWVAENERGKIVGCCGARIWSRDAEIISWIVREKYRNARTAKKLLIALIKNLKKRKGVRYIFALTVPELAGKYFRPLGFRPTGLQMFSAKVVEECQHCPKNRFWKGKYQCNEIALVLRK